MAAIENAVRLAVAENVTIGLGTDTPVYPYPRAAEEFGEPGYRYMRHCLELPVGLARLRQASWLTWSRFQGIR